jgi:hypothetical protein
MIWQVLASHFRQFLVGYSIFFVMQISSATQSRKQVDTTCFT